MSSAAVDVDALTSGETTGRLAAPSARWVIRQRNGYTRMSSTAGSRVANGGVGEKAPALPPPRLPRRNKKSKSFVSASTSAGDEGRSVQSAMAEVVMCAAVLKRSSEPSNSI
ncbi:unnamed protein product [Macrosiphum euphorbiae]|nr:unnamed protein product [Macrosiphum euphorbiae]